MLFNEAGFEDLDQTGGRAADLVSRLADAAVPADPTARLPPDEFVSPAMAAALALPLQDVMTRLGLGAFMSGARKAGAHVAQDLLRNELGLVRRNHAPVRAGTLDRAHRSFGSRGAWLCVLMAPVWCQGSRSWRAAARIPSR